MVPLSPLRAAGSLNVYIYPSQDGDDLSSKDPVYVLSGPQTGFRVWLQARVNYTAISAKSRVALEFVVGDGTAGDIAVDDVSISSNICPGLTIRLC